MTRLLIATGIFHPESGGPATYLYHLLPHLQAHGYEVQVITYGDPTTDNRAYPYPVTRINRAQPLPLRMAAYTRAVRPLMAWADVIYRHTLMLPLQRFAWEPRKPTVYKIVGDQAWERAVRKHWIPPTADIDTFELMRYRHPLVRWNRRARRRELHRANGVIVPSNYLKAMVVRWGLPSSRVQVVYNALPPTHQAVTLSQAEARAQLELDPERPIILTVARLVPWKGIDNFIRALDAVPDALLIVAGDGADRANLEAVAAAAGMTERVRFLGRVPREQVALYMAAADYVGLYSGYEGLPHVLIESLTAGTPIIASEKGGNPEVVTHDVNGLLVPYRDDDALRAALRAAFAPGKRAALAANTSDGLARFTYERMVDDTIAALQKLVNN